jgi:hypothetical protein
LLSILLSYFHFDAQRDRSMPKMPRILQQLWADDAAAILSTELVLILAIVVFGIIPGLIAVRNSTNAALATVANLISILTPQFTFSQVAPGQFVLLVNFGVNPNAPPVVGTQVAPILVNGANVVVAPAP